MKHSVFLVLFLFITLLIASLLINSTQKDPGGRPNILLAISDDQSYPHAGIYGCKALHTPAFDRVASEGILFNNAFSAAPGCSPSRASLLTGKHIWELEDAGSHASYFPRRFMTYTEILDSLGYLVGYTGKGWGPGNWRDSGRKTNPAGKEFNQITNAEVPQHINQTDYYENFRAFLQERDKNQPFCFWYGATEPHRRYEKRIGVDNHMLTDAVEVPGFLPDVIEVRSDMLDYMFEIQHFDDHLGRMIDLLEEMEELDNTLIIVTSDNGMPFPRAKANVYEYGIHMPLAIRWGAAVKPGRVIDDLISLTDIAPTILEVLEEAGALSDVENFNMSGSSFLSILLGEESGLLEPGRSEIYSGRERHSCSRWNNLSYPMRALRTHEYLYIKNFKPERWPAGAPVRYDETGNLLPGYHDIDDFSESYVFGFRSIDTIKHYFDLAVAKRPVEELYDIRKDPGCLNNLATLPDHQEVLIELRKNLNFKLMKTGDPRLTGDGDIWESYERFNVMRSFPVPDWATDSTYFQH